MSHLISDEEFNNLVRLDFFADIGKAIAAPATLKGVLAAVMDHVADIFAPSNWSVMLRKPNGDLVFASVTGGAENSLLGTTIPRGRGIAGWIAEKGQPLVIPDVSLDSRFDPAADTRSGFVTRSIIGVPLKTRTRVFGVIELVNRHDGAPFSTYDLKLLSTIGDFAAIALEKIYYMQHLKRAALTDPLTGLHNRRLLLPTLDREIQRHQRDRRPFSLLFVDIDDFKDINDRHGHQTGDEALRTVARVIREAVRKSDFVCRFGGDEFLLVLEGQTESQAATVRDRILANPLLTQVPDVGILNLSIGIKAGAGTDAAALIRDVDRNMYDDKADEDDMEPENLDHAWESIRAES